MREVLHEEGLFFDKGLEYATHLKFEALHCMQEAYLMLSSSYKYATFSIKNLAPSTKHPLIMPIS